MVDGAEEDDSLDWEVDVDVVVVDLVNARHSGLVVKSARRSKVLQG